MSDPAPLKTCRFCNEVTGHFQHEGIQVCDECGYTSEIDPSQTIIAEADMKMDRGKEKYGEFDPVTDERDLLEEMVEELLDVINYARMQILKVREMQGRKEET